MRWFFPVIPAVIAASTAAFVATPATPARACGGFFCDNAQPVNQAAERIIFSRGDDGQVTAVIQILYAGPAERFAWMLPVHGSPTIAVSSDLAFTRLQQATNPRYQMTTTVEGDCRAEDDRLAMGGADASASAGFDTSPAPSPNDVSVVDQGTVGPYDYVVISVASGMSAPATVAVEWLRDNGFDIDELGAERIGPYLESGMNLLSFRLTKGNDAGSIRPVIIGFGAGLASIPIRPTAVAAVADMGVMVWVLGPHRAIPVNYASLELNEALINWFSPNATYNNVVTEAANQAGGQGFVTEMSVSGGFGATVFTPDEEAAWKTFRADPARLGQLDTFRDFLTTYRTFDGLGEAVTAHLDLPDGVTAAELLGCPWCVSFPTDEAGRLRDFDATAFVDSVETLVIRPMEATAKLLDRPHLTRLYTTMSADEMTVDPSFDFNADLPDVAATRMANRIIECSPTFSQSDAPWRVELRDGQIVRGFGNSWPFALGTSEMPANSRILRVGRTGPGEIVVDNGTAIQADVSAHNARITSQIAERTGSRTAAEGGGCTGGGAGTSGWVVLMGTLFGGLFLRRRRNAAKATIS